MRSVCEIMEQKGTNCIYLSLQSDYLCYFSAQFFMAPPRKAVIAVSSAHAPLYPEGKETGLFITEALHPFKVFKKAGFDVDLVSENGTYSPDWLSQQKDWLPDEDRAVWEDHSSEFRSKLDKLLNPGDIKPENVR